MPPVHRPTQREAYPSLPPHMARDMAHKALLVEISQRETAVRWTAADHGVDADKMMEYQRGKPGSMNDSVMGSMRQHLFLAMGVFRKPRNALRLMDALERAKVVSHMPRRLVNIDGLDAALNAFRYGALFGKPLSSEKKARIREVLLTFERIAQQRDGYLKESAKQRTALAENVGAKVKLLEPYGHDLKWYRDRLLADGSVQRMQDAYVRCTELLRTYPSQLPRA